MSRPGALARPGLVGHLAALGAGALLPLALAPFDCWPLAVLVPLALLALLADLAPAAAACRAWFFGTGMFGAGASSVRQHPCLRCGAGAARGRIDRHILHGPCPVSRVHVLGLGTLAARSSGGIAPGFRARMDPWRVVARLVPDRLSVALPRLRPGRRSARGLVAGGWRPWHRIHHGIQRCSAPSHAAPQPARTGSALALAAALWLGAPLLERIEWTRADGDALGVALVQGNVEQNLKWVPGQLEEILAPPTADSASRCGARRWWCGRSRQYPRTSISSSTVWHRSPRTRTRRAAHCCSVCRPATRTTSVGVASTPTTASRCSVKAGVCITSAGWFRSASTCRSSAGCAG